MLLFTPQIQLFTEEDMNNEPGVSTYIVHAVTFCSHTNFRADGYLLHASTPDEEDTIHLDLLVKKDGSLDDITCLTPVVHTIKLGPIKFEGDGLFSIKLIQQEAVRTRGLAEADNNVKGNTTVSTTSSKSVDRPFGEMPEVPAIF